MELFSHEWMWYAFWPGVQFAGTTILAAELLLAWRKNKLLEDNNAAHRELHKAMEGNVEAHRASLRARDDNDDKTVTEFQALVDKELGKPEADRDGFDWHGARVTVRGTEGAR